ncbi:Putative NTF2-like domain superfamily protein [Septoria linicola]|uniref:NTF2-like domain superfamily protein n=1 Tax=Septoria linicola TaxID=215465 RepID=A0A9Q9ARA8_9PEZI|nr:putative NTF2-like domain superfamily protein [Septoria linicola]USW50616.1 Putative NTF2-like domain superfamily protein [Septoria linicola]
MTKSPQRTAAEAVVEAFNRMDIDAIISYRHEDCLRYILPAALGHKPQSNEVYRKSLEALKPIFHNFTLVLHDVVEDKEASRICMYLTARAETLAGQYINEYMWTLDFDGAGEKITKWTEFVDSVVNRDFWPKLKEAMSQYRQTRAAAEKLEAPGL